MRKNTQKHVLVWSFTVLALTLVLSACDSTDPDDSGAGEEEAITNAIVTLTSTADPSDVVTAEATFDPATDDVLSRDTLNLTAGTTYTGEIELLNETADDPIERDVTAEIEEEADEHQFFYVPEGGIAGGLVTVTPTDTDSDEDGQALPLGLAFELVVADAAPATSGELRVVLRHYEEDANLPDDKASDTPTSDEVSGVVENDIDFTYPVEVQTTIP